MNLTYEEEIWKDIPGYEGSYQVSNLGRVKSLKRRIPLNNGYRYYTELIRKFYTDKDGYKQVNLHKNKRYKYFRVHRLVLLAFRGKPTPEKPWGLHLDDNPSNNRLSNLEWGTPTENTKQCFDRGRNSKMFKFKISTGENHPRSKKIKQFSIKGEYLNTFVSIIDASKRTGLSRNTIAASLSAKITRPNKFIFSYF